MNIYFIFFKKNTLNILDKSKTGKVIKPPKPKQVTLLLKNKIGKR